MIELGPMAAHTDSSSLECLEALIQEHARQTHEWRMQLPIMRAQSAAVSVLLRELARTPPGAVLPKRVYADVVVAAPTKEWAEDFAARLSDALPTGALVELGVPGRDGLGVDPPLTGYTVRCKVTLPGMRGRRATAQVRLTLANLEDLQVHYIETLDLIAVSPDG